MAADLDDFDLDDYRVEVTSPAVNMKEVDVYDKDSGELYNKYRYDEIHDQMSKYDDDSGKWSLLKTAMINRAKKTRASVYNEIVAGVFWMSFNCDAVCYWDSEKNANETVVFASQTCMLMGMEVHMQTETNISGLIYQLAKLQKYFLNQHRHTQLK